MSEERERAAVQRLLGLLARHLEDYAEGDETALEGLGEILDQGAFSSDQVETAVLMLRSLAGERLTTIESSAAVLPEGLSQRILSAQERESLSTEAWGYLLDLTRRGALDSEQLEVVLERLATSGVRPVDVEMAHEVAMRVALSGAGPELRDLGGELAH